MVHSLGNVFVPSSLKIIGIEVGTITDTSSINVSFTSIVTSADAAFAGIVAPNNKATDNAIANDKGRNNTRQLDYYKSHNVTTTANYQYAIKKYNNERTDWWLRTADSDSTHNFYYVYRGGDLLSGVCYDEENGYSPAFRLATGNSNNH